MSCKFFNPQVLSARLSCARWCGRRGSLGRWRVEGTFRGGFCWESNMEYCLLLGEGGCFEGFFFFIFCFWYILLTVARSRVLDFQQHTHRASGLLHGTFTGIRGVVAGTHRLVRPALRTALIAQWAAAPAHPSIPQTLLPRAALDVLTRLGLCKDEREKSAREIFD